MPGGATRSARMVSLVIPAGTAYGLAVFVVASFFGLPIVAKLTASGPTITKMTKMVGWSGFAVEHLMVGTEPGLLRFALSCSGQTEPQLELRSPVVA